MMNLVRGRLVEFSVLIPTLFVCLAAAVILRLFLLLYFVESTSLAITTVIVLLFTVLTFSDERPTTRWMSVGGVAIYLLSWPVEWWIGETAGVRLYLTSVLLWSVALSIAMTKLQLQEQQEQKNS